MNLNKMRSTPVKSPIGYKDLSSIKLDESKVGNDFQKDKEEIFQGYFTINRRNKKGSAVYANKQITDQMLFDFLMHIALERVISFSIPNSCLSDAGATILLQYFEDQFSLNTLKVYNNVMMLVGKEKEIPYLLTGT